MTEFEGELKPKIFKDRSLDLSNLYDDVLKNEEKYQEIRIEDKTGKSLMFSFFIRVHRERGVRYLYCVEFNYAAMRQAFKDLATGSVKDVEPRGFRVRLDHPP